MSLHRLVRSIYRWCVLLGVAGCISMPAYAGDHFQPVSDEELKMTSEPQAPGAPAIILYRQVDRDDTGLTAHEDDYFRVKILTEEGRKYADIEIPFFKENGNNIVNVHARTIRPDGSIANFDGKVFEKSIVKAHGLKYVAKTFTLPDVQVGSIIEYYYTLDLAEYVLYDSRWILSEDLFTKHAKFSLKPYTITESRYGVQWSWQRLPAGTAQPKEGPDHIVRLEVNNIPAFHTEDYMPPEEELKARVDFNYSDEGFEKEPVQYWKKKGKKLNSGVEGFVKGPRLDTVVAQIVSPSDAPDVKLQKIYARVQQLRNTSYEVEKTEQEMKREKEKAPGDVGDVWKRGYGNSRQINWLFLALVRAAGFEASGVVASDRYRYFFNPAMMDDKKLDASMVLVKVEGKDVFCAPGSAFAPYGVLPWPDTGIPGLRLDKDGGTWIQTPIPESGTSRIERRADLNFSSDTGELTGKLTITFTGLEALERRVEERHEDDAARKKFLEDQAKEYIPVASEVELKNTPEWKSSSAPLIAEYDLKIPGWVSSAGRRALFPVGLFSASEKHVFDHAERVHPIYFEFPSEKLDDITVALPAGWQVSSLPPEQNEDVKAVAYVLKAENGKQNLHLERKLRINLMLLDTKYYPSLQSFFQTVRKGDEQQIVLQPGAASASK